MITSPPRTPARTFRAFTLVELLVVIGIIALLVGILLPSLQSARAASQRVACLSNIRQLTTAMTMYNQENQYRMIGEWTVCPMWPYLLKQYLGYRPNQPTTDLPLRYPYRPRRWEPATRNGQQSELVGVTGSVAALGTALLKLRDVALGWMSRDSGGASA